MAAAGGAAGGGAAGGASVCKVMVTHSVCADSGLLTREDSGGSADMSERL